MKKLLCLLIIACLPVLSACGTKPVKDDLLDSVLKEYLENLDTYEIPVREYGSPASHIHMDDKIVMGIIYPETEVATLNKAINKWIVETVEKYTAEAEEFYTGKESAEVDYED